MKLVFIVLFTLFISSAFSVTIGAQRFYAEVLLTNKEYGSGAVFKSNVWYDAASQQMRLDYFNFNGVKFMSVYYNYQTKDKYQVCSGNCSRATWNGDIPLFFGSDSTNFQKQASCVTPDWPGPRSCVASCNTYRTNPVQQTGINSLSFNDTGSSLCLVRWTASTGFTYGPEWHVQKYLTTGYTNGDPGNNTVYTSVIQGKDFSIFSSK